MSNYIIIRHAQSNHNKGKTKNLDSALTHLGSEQAENLANELCKYDLTGHVMHVSPFLRCLMTAETITKKIPKIRVIIDPLISEALGPKYAGVFIHRRQYAFEQFDWSHFVGAGFLQQHEDGNEFYPRVEAAFDRMTDKTIVVSHGMFCLAFAKKAAGTLKKNEHWDDSIGNASITHVSNKSIVKWGCRKHLGTI